MSRSGQRAVGLAGLAVADELHADHQPAPAHVADPLVLRRDPFQAGSQLDATGDRVVQEALLVDGLQHGQTGGAGDGVAGVGGAVGAPAPALLERS